MGRRQSTNTSDSDESYDVVVDDKAFHETYLSPFYEAVKNGIGGAMCAMNRVNGSYSCENQDLLATYLKVELGFPGIVHADQGAQKSAINSANAGMDFSSYSYWTNTTMDAALANGSFTEERLTDMAVRNLMGYFRLNQDEGYPAYASPTDHVDVRGNHSAMARSYAADSIALLKNTNSALPLVNKTSISVFGYHAAPRYYGANTGLDVQGTSGPTMLGREFQPFP
jgi:beta-glucosidase